jgi:hypothetical protein
MTDGLCLWYIQRPRGSEATHKSTNQSQRKREREASQNAHEQQKPGFTTGVLWPSSVRSHRFNMVCLYRGQAESASTLALRAQV